LILIIKKGIYSLVGGVKPMSFVELITLLSGCVGLTLIITSSLVMHPLRSAIERLSSHLGELINCPMCTGFWVGLSSSLFYDTNPLWIGCAVSLFSWAVYVIVSSLNSLGEYFELMIEDNGDDDSEDDE
jgi:hypothetical protein